MPLCESASPYMYSDCVGYGGCEGDEGGVRKMVPDNGQLPVSDAVISPGSFAWRLPQISCGCSTFIHPGDRRRIAVCSFIGTARSGPPAASDAGGHASQSGLSHV